MKRLSAAIAATALVLMGACGAPTTRAGGDVDPVTLTTANETDLLHLLTQDSADGAVRVQAGKPMESGDDEDGATLNVLAAGDADLGMIRSGRLVKEGAASLAPLGSPFLVTSTEHGLAVARDKVAEPLMSDLGQLGLVGLGMLPIGAYHPFGYHDPLLGAEDYNGATINVRVDAAWDDILRALGASGDDSVDGERAAKVASRELRGIPAFVQNFGAVDTPAVMTGNVALFERFDVVVIREGAWDSLSTAQQDELTTMVATARDEAHDAMTTDDLALRDWCNVAGASTTTATDDAVASLHAALDPVAAEVATAHPDTVATIKQLGVGIPTLDLQCGEESESSDWGFRPEGDQTVLDGTWRFEVTEEELLEAGASASDAAGNSGVWQMTLTEGAGTGGKVGGDPCVWTFGFAGDHVQWDLGASADCDAPLFTGTYEISGDTVRFGWDYDDGDPYQWIPTVLFAEAVRVQG